MNRPADVDKMVSSFLSELNTLSNSLRLTPDKTGRDSHTLDVQRNEAGLKRITAGVDVSSAGIKEECRPEGPPERDSISNTNSVATPCRNIEVLLMNNNRPVRGMNGNPEGRSQTSNAVEDVGPLSMPFSSRSRPGKRVLSRLRSSSRWPLLTAWVRKFRG